ncbi:MAG: hypothetical protein ACWGPN_05360 [Gammaproteobacteria bacterium]
MPPDSFFNFLATSVYVLKRDVPQAYASLSQAMSGLRARLSVGAHERVIGFDDGVFRMLGGESEANVDVRFAEQVILDLVDGKVMLEEAILDETLFMRGEVEAIEQFYDALLVYLDGTLRSPAFPILLDHFRRGSTEPQKCVA